ncbi:MAG: hypothetical protein QNK20_10600 [Aureibaculum sp.]|nr:hypothetical protein [Aureibaculum sp.]
MAYKIDFHTKWADFNANKHMGHTTYNDYAAEIKIYAAWIDLKKRKLTEPPVMVVETFNSLERTENYEEISLTRNSTV